MSDETRRKRERDAKASGEPAAQAAALRAAERSAPWTKLEYLQALVGHWIYVETAKLNYRGVLLGCTPEGDLLMSPCFRTGDWGDEPSPQYEERMESGPEHPRLVAWGGICELGLMQAHWPKDGPPAGRRAR